MNVQSQIKPHRIFYKRLPDWYLMANEENYCALSVVPNF